VTRSVADRRRTLGWIGLAVVLAVALVVGVASDPPPRSDADRELVAQARGSG
jgi:hypothetical protein